MGLWIFTPKHGFVSVGNTGPHGVPRKSVLGKTLDERSDCLCGDWLLWFHALMYVFVKKALLVIWKGIFPH